MWPRVDLPGVDLTVSTYSLLSVAGWFVFLVGGMALTRSRPDLRRHWWWLFLGMGLCYSIGASLMYRLVHGGPAALLWGRLRNEPPGRGFWGGPLLFLGWTGVYVLARRIRAYPFLDAFAVAFAAAHVPMKLACFAAGCCFGRPTHSALGVAVHASLGDPTRLHPTQLYEATFHLLTALALGWLYARGRLRGRLVMVLGSCQGAGLLILHGTRAVRGPMMMDSPLSMRQFASLLVLAFSLTYLLLAAAGPRRTDRTEPA